MKERGNERHYLIHSPLIVHAWSEKAKKELLASQQGTKLKKDKKQAKNVYGEIAEALYWMNGKPDVAYADWTEELLDEYASVGTRLAALSAAVVSASSVARSNAARALLYHTHARWLRPS